MGSFSTLIDKNLFDILKLGFLDGLDPRDSFLEIYSKICWQTLEKIILSFGLKFKIEIIHEFVILSKKYFKSSYFLLPFCSSHINTQYVSIGHSNWEANGNSCRNMRCCWCYCENKMSVLFQRLQFLFAGS